MRKIKLSLISLLISVPIGQGAMSPVLLKNKEKYIVDRLYERATAEHEWNTWIKAIIQVESGGDDFAVGLTNDNGCLQITPILVAEVNRLVSGELYLVSDAFSRRKSIEMFNIIQSHYNPQRDRHLALKIWNPKAPISYHTKVEREYEKLMNK